MKRNLFRLLALTLLLALLTGTVPALAAAGVAIVKPDIFWQGDWQRVELENLPKGSIPNQEKILQGLREKQAPTPPPPAEENNEGEDAGQTLNRLPPEYKEKIAGMSPEQRAMLAQSMAGI